MKRVTAQLYLLLAVLASFYGVSALAQDNHDDKPESVESYKIESKVNDRKVITWVHLFGRPPFKNQKLIGYIRDLKLDHVAMIREEPSAELDELSTQIQNETDTPVVDVQPKKGFFQRFRQVWNLSFKNQERKPGPADYRYGIVSTMGETGVFSAMVFTTPGIPLENAITLVVAQTLLSYTNNVWNNAVNTFLSASFKKIGKATSDRAYFFRSSLYDYITSQLFKLIQSPELFLTGNVQSTILMNAIFSGVGDNLISNSNYLSYKTDKIKLAKMNFYTFLFSNILGAVDLMRPNWMPVITTIGSYDFSVSSAILIGYYTGMVYMLKKHPEQLFSVVDRFEKGLKKVGNWISGRITSCNEILSGRSNNDGDQPTPI